MAQRVETEVGNPYLAAECCHDLLSILVGTGALLTRLAAPVGMPEDPGFAGIPLCVTLREDWGEWSEWIRLEFEAVPGEAVIERDARIDGLFLLQSNSSQLSLLDLVAAISP